MKTYSKDEVLGLADRLAKLDVYGCNRDGAEMLRAFAHTLCGPVAVPDVPTATAGDITSVRNLNGEHVWTVTPKFGDPFEVIRYDPSKAGKCQIVLPEQLSEGPYHPQIHMDENTAYVRGWNACREAMLDHHHPTTEKGCE